MKLVQILQEIEKDKIARTLAIEAAIKEWNRIKRRMGCVSATNWFCKRVPGFHPIRITNRTSEGEIYQHVIVSDGKITVDLADYANKPD